MSTSGKSDLLHIADARRRDVIVMHLIAHLGKICELREVTDPATRAQLLESACRIRGRISTMMREDRIARGEAA